MPPEPIPFGEFRRRVLTLYRPPLRAPATQKKMAAALDTFGRLASVASTADLDTEHVAAFVAARADSGANVNTTISELRAVRTACLFAVAEGWVERGPQWKRLIPRPGPFRSVRHYSLDQVARLLAHLEASVVDWKSHRLYALAATVVHTGLRRTEALRLWKADVDLAAGFVAVVPRHRLKTPGSAAPVPLPPGLRPVLGRWLPESGPVWLFPGVSGKGPWVNGCPPYRACDALRAAGDAVGMDRLGFHSLRHTLGKLMVAEFGCSVDQARSVLRHASSRTTEDFYLHRDDLETLARIGRRIAFRAPDPA